MSLAIELQPFFSNESSKSHNVLIDGIQPDPALRVMVGPKSRGLQWEGVILPDDYETKILNDLATRVTSLILNCVGIMYSGRGLVVAASGKPYDRSMSSILKGFPSWSFKVTSTPSAGNA